MVGESTLWLGFLTAFFVVLLATPSLIKVAKMKHLVDEPSEERKMHSRSIPTIGGIIIFGAIIFSYCIWYPEDCNINFGSISNFKHLIACLVLLFFVGVKDDIIGTAPMKKLMAHVVVGFILVIMADIRITEMHGIFGIYELVEWHSYFVSLFVYIVIVNAVNLIDGLDGLAGGIGMIISGLLGLYFYLAGNVPMALLSCVLCGALFGFLIFNFSPARIFMGDSGSLVIGAIISVIAIEGINQNLVNAPDWLRTINRPVLIQAILIYPLIDTLRVFMVRAIKGVSPFTADKNHIHHRFIKLGLNHRQTVLCLYAFNFIVVAFVLLVRFENPTISLVAFLGFSFALVGIPFMIKAKGE